jgi:superfamily II DNA or RNA helicase
MVKCIISNTLEVIGLPADLEDYYQYKCRYDTSVYSSDDVPEILNLFERTTSGISIPRGLLFEVKNFCNSRGLPLQVVNEGYKGELFEKEILPEINYTSGVYGYQGKSITQLIADPTARLQAFAAAGKTSIMCMIASILKRGPCLYLAHKDRLLKQFALTAEKVLGIDESDIGVIKQKKRIIKPLTYGSLCTLGKEDFDLESFKYKFNTVFFDECHLSTALTYRRVLLGLAPERLYGFSATPDHYASDDLTHLMQALLGPITVVIKDSDVPQRLMPTTYSRLTKHTFYFNADSNAEEWRKRKQRHNLYDAIGNSSSRNNLIISDALKLIKAGYKLLICVNRVSHGKELFDLLTKNGINLSFPYKITETKTGEIKSQVDHKKLNDDVLDVERGKLDGMIGTYKLFDTGFDCPSLSAILYAAPFSGDNTTQIIQSIGRVQRYRVGKPSPVLLDYVDDSQPVNILKHWASKRTEYLQITFKDHDTIG